MPKYSIITIASNGLSHTLKCVESILANTKDFELIIVDNATDDGTEQWLDAMILQHPCIKVLRGQKNLSFAANNNCGLTLVSPDAQYIIFLNNDTIVSKDWLERMEAHFANVPLNNLGAVGPVCNSSNGRQMVGKQDPEAWHAQHQSRWKQTGVLYGWCMMIKKSIIDQIGGFDERFHNSWEDNDLSLRILLAGYNLAIAYDTYIDHMGQATLSKAWSQEDYLKNGVDMRQVFFDKYDTSEKKKKLVAVYRTNGGVYLEQSLEQTSKFADSIVIHFCRVNNLSSVRSIYVNYLKEKFPKIIKVEFYDGIFQEDYERGCLLDEALKMQADGQADWCISIDDDEIYEDKFIGRVQKMMNPRNPQILGYWCNWRTIWDARLGQEYYRQDSTFGAFSNYRFFRLIPGMKIQSRHPEGHHCGSAPWIADENLQWTNIRVKHMGYDTPAQRQKKFEFYEANDHFKTRADIGYDDYSHLIELNPVLVPYRDKHGISLTCMFKNDEKWIEGMLENLEPLVDEVVLVDTGSTDSSVDLIARFAHYSPVPVKLISFPWPDNYSLPRNFAKLHATQPWIMFMDTDERFRPESIRDIWYAAEQDLDVVMFNVLNYLEAPDPRRETRVAPTQAARLFRNIPEFYFTGIIHETIDDSTTTYQQSKKLRGVMCKTDLHHYGYLQDKDRMKQKLEYYETLNKKQVEVTEGKDPRCYFNLALHYLNDEKSEEALKNFQKCLELSPRMWHASQQMAMLNLQSSKTFLNNALAFMPATHPSHPKMVQLLDFLNRECHGFVKVT